MGSKEAHLLSAYYTANVGYQPNAGYNSLPCYEEMYTFATSQSNYYNMVFNCLSRAIGYPTLVNKGWAGCTGGNKCGRCEGDCDSDNDCHHGYKCFQRSDVQ